MELVPYKQFAKLRMKQFVPKGTKLFEDDGCEWMGGMWIVDQLTAWNGFARPRATPSETGGLEIIFPDMPKDVAAAILNAIRLPLKPGLSLDEVRSVLGEPERTESFVDDRKTYEFAIGTEHPYYLSCTLFNSGGLMGLAVIRKDVLSRIEAEEAAFQAEIEAEQGNG